MKAVLNYALKCGLVISFGLVLMLFSIGCLIIFPYVAYKARLGSNRIIIMEGWSFEYK